MTSSFMSFFSSEGFMPHGHCYLWNPALVGTMVVSDLLIGFAYVSISLSLYFLVKKIKLPFSALFLAFGLFIGACGATHFMEVLTLWVPVYWASAAIKTVTMIASVITAASLFPLAPKILQFAETARRSDLHRIQLEETNLELRTKSEELARANLVLAEHQKLLTHSAKMSALGEMAGGIAHEINSPLGIITVRANLIERMQRRSQLTPEIISREAKLIATTALRIGDIIKGLRTFAREGGDDPFEWVSAASILEDALVLCRTKFKNNSIDLILTPVPESLKIECRPVQIGQVILNLLNNAFDAVQKLPEKWVRMEVRVSGGRVLFSVTDSGKGIREDILSKLMQPFFTTKEVGKGTGLGLSISKGIAEAHRGTLEVNRSSLNTSFTLEIPTAQEPRIDTL